MVLLLASPLAGRAGEVDQHLRTDALQDALVSADTPEVPGIVEQLGPSRGWADPLLAGKFKDSAPDSSEKLHACLALVPATRPRSIICKNFY